MHVMQRVNDFIAKSWKYGATLTSALSLSKGLIQISKASGKGNRHFGVYFHAGLIAQLIMKQLFLFFACEQGLDH